MLYALTKGHSCQSSIFALLSVTAEKGSSRRGCHGTLLVVWGAHAPSSRRGHLFFGRCCRAAVIFWHSVNRFQKSLFLLRLKGSSRRRRQSPLLVVKRGLRACSKNTRGSVFVGIERPNAIPEGCQPLEQLNLNCSRSWKAPLFNSLPAGRGENGREAPREGVRECLRYFLNRSGRGLREARALPPDFKRQYPRPRSGVAGVSIKRRHGLRTGILPGCDMFLA